MEDKSLSNFISDLMNYEIAPSIPYEIDEATKQVFISKVLDRFRNPHINHYWKNITFNYSSKLRLRCIPLLLNYYKNNETVPPLFALGFAAYLYFMKAVKQDGKDYFGEFNSQSYLIEDEMAERFYHLWNNKPVDTIVKEVLKNESLWDFDLTKLVGFQERVTQNLNSIITNGMKETLKKNHPQKSFVPNES
jgi:tagaturonate reductase